MKKDSRARERRDEDTIYEKPFPQKHKDADQLGRWESKARFLIGDPRGVPAYACASDESEYAGVMWMFAGAFPPDSMHDHLFRKRETTRRHGSDRAARF